MALINIVEGFSHSLVKIGEKRHTCSMAYELIFELIPYDIIKG